VTAVLRAGVLAGVRVAIAGPPTPVGAALRERLGALGASVGEAAGTLVWDATAMPAPRSALDGAWAAVRPAAEAMIAAGDGGQVVLLAPPPGDAHAEAARAGLENLARTLSIEWSRHGIRPVAILPGTATTPAAMAELVGFLASPAGGYYSGCAFTLA
jgi:NAD(P)-dependent dehydrogenase (short-subunit alcohol dehydrogenase family)